MRRLRLARGHKESKERRFKTFSVRTVKLIISISERSEALGCRVWGTLLTLNCSWSPTDKTTNLFEHHRKRAYFSVHVAHSLLVGKVIRLTRVRQSFPN